MPKSKTLNATAWTAYYHFPNISNFKLIFEKPDHLQYLQQIAGYIADLVIPETVEIVIPNPTTDRSSYAASYEELHSRDIYTCLNTLGFKLPHRPVVDVFVPMLMAEETRHNLLQ